MEDLKIGSDVLYVLESGHSKGEIRPAKVVRDWSNSTYYPDGTVNIQVLTDGYNDGLETVISAMQSNGEAVSMRFTDLIVWRTSVRYDENKVPGTWHWPEKDGKSVRKGDGVRYVLQLGGMVGVVEYAALVSRVYEVHHPESFPADSIEAHADKHTAGDVRLHVLTENTVTVLDHVPYSADASPNSWHWPKNAWQAE